MKLRLLTLDLDIEQHFLVIAIKEWTLLFSCFDLDFLKDQSSGLVCNNLAWLVLLLSCLLLFKRDWKEFTL